MNFVDRVFTLDKLPCQPWSLHEGHQGTAPASAENAKGQGHDMTTIGDLEFHDTHANDFPDSVHPC